MLLNSTSRALAAAIAAAGLAGTAAADTVLFDFDTAPLHSPLPLDLTVGGVTAHLSATGEGYSIQRADALGFTPVGFSGYCVYPSSVFPADLLVAFSATLTEFSILYAPEEYDCDSSATMRVTAYMDGAYVGTATMTAQPGTWPTATLAISASQGFDSVVVHYDQPPVTGGDWGPIFMADNMKITTRPAICRPDCNKDGRLNINDFICFQNEWRRQTAYGDYNGDGKWNVNDFIAFQSDFARGCP